MAKRYRYSYSGRSPQGMHIPDGKFPMTSTLGNKYVLLMYVFDANAILVEPFKRRSGSHLLEAYTKKVGHLTNRGYIPRLHCLDNEASVSLNKFNRQEVIGYQLVSPQIYRVNATDIAIITWKYCFIAGLAITDTRFPMHLCCCLIPQATMTLNMLIPFQQNPTMLEYTAIEVPFDFNKITLAPNGSEVVVHKNHNNGKFGESME